MQFWPQWNSSCLWTRSKYYQVVVDRKKWTMPLHIEKNQVYNSQLPMSNLAQSQHIYIQKNAKGLANNILCFSWKTSSSSWYHDTVQAKNRFTAKEIVTSSCNSSFLWNLLCKCQFYGFTWLGHLSRLQLQVFCLAGTFERKHRRVSSREKQHSIVMFLCS